MARRKAPARTTRRKPTRKAAPARPKRKARPAARARKGVKKGVKTRVRKAVRKATRKVARTRPARKRTPAPKRPATIVARPAPAARKKAVPAPPPRAPRLERQRRVLREEHGVPSSLDLDRHGSSARTGREELNERRRHDANMTPDITAGDVDVNVQDAYFSGDEAPGGDNQTPDQDVVEEIGRAMGVEYHDSEELQGGDELTKRDRRRWELDPASSEDYRDRKKKGE